MSSPGCAFKNMTALDIDLPVWECHPSSWPQGGPLLPGLAVVAQVKPTDWHWHTEFHQHSPDGTKRPINHLSKLPAQSKRADSTLDPHIPLSPQVSNKFLPWSKSVSFSLDKYQLSEYFLICKCSHQDWPPLQMRWGQCEPTPGV